MHTDDLLPYLLIFGSIAPLAVGPFLARLADRAEAARSVVDAFAAVSLGGIVILHIWPHAFLTAGAWTLVGGLLGLLLPFVLHGSLHSHERKIYPGFVFLAFVGLAVHATLDGVALFSPLAEEAMAAGEALSRPDAHYHDQGSAMLLALAVILHRLPMGLAVWWFAAPILGRRFATGLLLAIAAATVLGFSVAGQLLVDLSMPGIAVFEATIAGMLLHVVMGHDHGHAEQGVSAGHHHDDLHLHEPPPLHGHSHDHDHSHGHDPAEPSAQGTVPWASAVGTLAGAVLVGGLFKIHPMEQRLTEALSFRDTFLGLAYTLAPWLLLGVMLETVARWLATRGGLRAMGERLGRGDGGLASWVGSWRALAPVRRSELAWPAFLASWGLMGGTWTLWRWALILLVLWLGALLQSRLATETSGTDPAVQRPTTALRLWPRWQREAHLVLVWSLLGLGLVALLEPMVRWRLDAQPPMVGLTIAALLAMTFYRNALHGTILATLLLHWEWPATTVMTFLLVGSLWTVFSRLHETTVGKLRFWLLSASLLGVGGIVLLANLPESLLWGGADGWIGLRHLAGLAPCGVARGSAVVLVALGIWVLFQKGFRGLLHPIFDPAEAIDISGAPRPAERIRR